MLDFLGKKQITEVGLGDATEYEMTIMFSDIRNFTSLSEAMSPHDNFRFLNEILQRTGPIVRQNSGFIDKFGGDSIMALFPRTPEDSILSAIEMRKMLADYNARRLRKGSVQIGTKRAYEFVRAA